MLAFLENPTKTQNCVRALHMRLGFGVNVQQQKVQL